MSPSYCKYVWATNFAKLIKSHCVILVEQLSVKLGLLQKYKKTITIYLSGHNFITKNLIKYVHIENLDDYLLELLLVKYLERHFPDLNSPSFKFKQAKAVSN